MQSFSGGCHCGRLRFVVEGDLAETLECNCSVCTKKGFLHLIVPRARFRATGVPQDPVVYRFGTGVAQHMFCGVCGISPYYVPRSDPEKMDVNVRCIDGVDLAALRTTKFDAQNWEKAQNNRRPDPLQDN